eukprot:m.69283 g.69283  ORF g.69283 m.69283 type:complete len:51 (-) comp8267_c0_seq16:677-829(-)
MAITKELANWVVAIKMALKDAKDIKNEDGLHSYCPIFVQIVLIQYLYYIL